MRTANEYEIAIFKKEYCKNGEARISIGKDFEVDVESFEGLLPGKIVSSYATGNRDIENSFIMFRVCDVIKDIQYFPVFSETVGRKMLKSWNKPVPKKRSYEVKAVNTAIGSFLRKDINVQNENLQNLQDYILYLQTNVTGRRLRNTNFDTLRNIMRTEYPAEQVYFYHKIRYEF